MWVLVLAPVPPIDQRQWPRRPHASAQLRFEFLALGEADVIASCSPVIGRAASPTLASATMAIATPAIVVADAFLTTTIVASAGATTGTLAAAAVAVAAAAAGGGDAAGTIGTVAAAVPTRNIYGCSSPHVVTS